MADADNQPITDVTAWASALDASTRSALHAFGELLLGVTGQDSKPEDATRFTARNLGVAQLGLAAIEMKALAPAAQLTTALAVAELIAAHDPQIGPGQYANPPAWTVTEVGETTYEHPASLRAAFPAGTLLPNAPVVVAIRVIGSAMGDPQLTIFAPAEHRAGARAALDRIVARAEELSPYRGQAVRASYVLGRGLELTAMDLPASLTRASVIAGEAVWREIDLGISAVRDHHEMLNRHGLGSRRGVVLAGPPGTGKSAVSAAIARELVGEFTIIYVEAKTGQQVLGSVVNMAEQLEGPVLIVLEDVDLFVGDRRTGDSAGLAELLQAMEIASDARILSIASTNQASTLDKAAVRAGRFDSIVEIDYPDTHTASTILAVLVESIPGADSVDSAVVAAQLPAQTSGADLREIVRRALIAGAGTVSTAGLLAEVGSGRYRAQLPGDGQYL
ncbi:ATP-binding protein [Mycolicibacterium frederiksbergense]|uniref:AAA family ATPase n=1 Tax=Mycolicibacterium frederiksbergense TaxID=117567 RepID=UPI0021F386DC|nr:ATP-binding protein [Mycolicibacterium frederiksbergense]